MRLFPYSFYPHDDMVSAFGCTVERLNQMEAWCFDQFGPVHKDVWTRDVWTFRFRKEVNALAFRVRWCGSPDE
jgi:hypothetical protein